MEQNASQTHNDPFALVPGYAAWKAMLDTQTERFEKAMTEMERLERERHERAVTAIDDFAQLVKSGLEYQQKLVTDWRKLGLDAAKVG
jgi:hypothetical protein